MLAAGIVAEYNPFHNGHKYQIMQTRKAGASHIVVVMSGAAVQRGDIAVFDKYSRAQAAISNGADLVIELPAPYSCSNGEVFAKAAVQLLAGLGENVINMISFGCEYGEIEALYKAAEISEYLENSAVVKNLVSQGMTYPAAIAKAAEDCGCGEIFSSPNNVLAIEYIKAIKEFAPWISPYGVKRHGSSHDSYEFQGEFASATFIRELIRKSSDYSEFVPCVFDSMPSFMDNTYKAVLYRVMTVDKSQMMKLPDMSENIANRFLSVRESCSTLDQLTENLKSKNITMARVRRIILHLMLGITSEDIKPVPYGRILAFNDRGREILSVAKSSEIAYDTSLKKLEGVSAHAARVSQLEQNAVKLQELCVSGVPAFTNEYRRKITIAKK